MLLNDSIAEELRIPRDNKKRSGLWNSKQYSQARGSPFYVTA